MLRMKVKPHALHEVALIQVDSGRCKTDTAMIVRDWLVRNLPPDTTVIA